MSTTEATVQSTGEGHLFKAYLGDRWNAITPDIRNRFSQDPTFDQPVLYKGEMSVVRCSWPGLLLARLVQWTGALQPYRGAGVPVEIRVSARPGVIGVFKQRVYYFKGKKPFHFNSHMMMKADQKANRLLEYVGGGFGMQIHIDVKDGNLHFHDRGYFLKIGRWHLPLSYLLSPGDTYLLHENLGPDSFRIVIRIHHRLLGEMYYQEGIFRHAQAC